MNTAVTVIYTSKLGARTFRYTGDPSPTVYLACPANTAAQPKPCVRRVVTSLDPAEAVADLFRVAAAIEHDCPTHGSPPPAPIVGAQVDTALAQLTPQVIGALLSAASATAAAPAPEATP